MRILQVIDQLNVGGAEKIVVTLANLLEAAGHETAVLSILGKGPLAEDLRPGVRQLYLHRGWKWHPRFMGKLAEICRNYDVIHVHSAHNLRYVFLASRLFALRKPLFFHEHFGDIEISRAVSWHQRWIYPQVKMIAVSRKIAEWARDRVGVPEANLHLLHNIIPINFQEKQAEERQSELVQIVAVCNFRPTKNLEFLLRLFEQLAARMEANLTIIGQIADTRYYDKILRQMDTPTLKNKVSIIDACTDVQPLLGRFDLAIHPSRSESGPLVLIEYLGRGLPFLCYRTGEVAALLEPDFPECILEDFSTDAWIEAALRLLSGSRAAFSERAKKIHKRHFSEESYLRHCLEIYQSGLAS